MTEDDFFDAQFPRSASLLTEMRAADTELDRICKDYRDLFAELSRQRQSADVPQSRYIADLAESLSDLRSTIERRLRSRETQMAGKFNQIGET